MCSGTNWTWVVLMILIFAFVVLTVPEGTDGRTLLSVVIDRLAGVKADG